MKCKARICIIAIASVLMSGLTVYGQSGSGEEIGITKPSQESKRSFVITGIVASIPVTEGQHSPRETH